MFVIPIELKFFKFVRGPSLPPGNMPPPPHPEWKTPITREKISEREFKKRIISHSDIAQIIEKKISKNIRVEGSKFDEKKFKNILFNAKCESYKNIYILRFWKASGHR